MYGQYRNKRSFWLVSSAVYIVFILYVSVKPPATGAGGTSWTKETLHNLCHIPAYAILMFWIVGLLKTYKIESGIFIKSFVFSMLYGALMEFLQSFVPGRTPSVGDMMLNATGALIMTVLIKKGLLERIYPGK